MNTYCYKPFEMKKAVLTNTLFLLFSIILYAEGTRELAPNSNTVIVDANGVSHTTHDIAALHVDSDEYNNFASFSNPNPLSRLHIYVDDPSQECILLGFSPGELNGGSAVNYEYQIKDPNGNIIYGPITVTPGNAILNAWQEAHTGPAQLYGPTGYNALEIPSSALMSAGNNTGGNYYIEFRELSSGNAFLIHYWDITVVNCSGAQPVEKKGRIWSNNWAIFAINDFGFPNRPFNGAFYVCAPDKDNPNSAFITQVEFNGSGFRPAAFNVAFNSFGVQNTGSITVDRMSVEGQNLTTPEYEIFLNDPVDLCQTADQGTIDLTAVSRCSLEDFCIQFQTTKAGQIQILLDFDGPDNVYTPGTADVLITENISSGQVNVPTCLDWDGKDGLGNYIGDMGMATIPVVMSYAQGIYHFPIYDAELLTNGLRVNSVRPSGPSPLLYYDDSNISTANGTGEPSVQLSGCNVPCHSWTTYTNPGIPGFGNLNTINSWWFSQQVITKAVFNVPGIYTCSIDTIQALCPGDTASLKTVVLLEPDNVLPPVLLDVTWSGPAIRGSNVGEEIMIEDAGTYSATVRWLSELGDTCSTTCEVVVQPNDITMVRVDTLIFRGDTVTIYGDEYSEAGTYTKTINSQEECDTLLTINVRIQETVLLYDFDDCISMPSDSSNQDYSEFQPEYPNPLTCSDIDASSLYRRMPEVNQHSCTPGIDSTPAMCISILDTCAYIPGHDKAIVFEIEINPDVDTAVALTALSFYEKGPLMYNWINGRTGPNNYPMYFSVRILKNGLEIYNESDIPTNRDWTSQLFDFRGKPEFVAKDPATFRFEILPYCVVDFGANVSVWDIDELSVFASCTSPTNALPHIGGRVQTLAGLPLPGANVHVKTGHSKSFKNETTTNQDGRYLLKHNQNNELLLLSGEKLGDDLNGVSMKDAIMITQHLFGVNELNDPFQILAADVNGTESITISDVVEIRKLILGERDAFENRPSWMLGNPQAEMTLDNPWQFVSPIGLILDDNSQFSHDLLAVKTGDVSGDAKVKPDNVTRNDNSIEVNYFDKYLEHGTATDIVLSVSSREVIKGLQMALNLKNFILQDIHSSGLEIHDDNYSLSRSRILSLACVAEDYEVNEFKIHLQVIPLKSGQLSELIDINDRITPEIYLGQELIVHTPILTQRVSSNEDLNVSVFPNPFRDQVTFAINHIAGQELNIELFNASGQLIFEREIQSDQPTSSVVLNNEELKFAEGLIIYKVSSEKEIKTGIIVRK